MKKESKIVIYSENNQLRHSLNNKNIDNKHVEIERVLDYDMLLKKLEEDKCEFVILSDGLIDTIEEVEVIEKIIGKEKIIIDFDNIKKLKQARILQYKEKNYTTINKNISSEKEYEEYLTSLLTNKETNLKIDNLITFVGIYPGVGTTQISQSVAEMIADHNKQDVLMLYIDEADSTDFNEIEKDKGLISNLTKSKAETNVLGKSDIKSDVTKVNNLNVVRISEEVLFQEYSFNDEYLVAKNLIKSITEQFDLTIIDGTNLKNIYNPYVLSSITQSKINFIVDSQMPNHKKQLDKVQDVLEDFSVDEFLLITNKKKFKDSSLKSEKCISEDERTIDYYINNEFETEISKKTLYSLEVDNYKKDVKKIVSNISTILDVNFKVPETKRSFFRKRG
jgi:transcriptional regulator of NAD metabolism